MDPFDIDTPVDTIQAFASKFTPCLGMKEKVRMPKDKWFGLDQNTKDLWDEIDDKYKAVILGYTKSSSSSPFPNKVPIKPPFPPKPRRNINLHEMSAYEFLQVHSHELEPEPEVEETTIDESTNEVVDSESPDTLLINAAKGSRSNPLPPGDIRQVLSKNSKRSVNLAHVSYHKASSGQSLSLIDRGANGGVAGTDVRVILKPVGLWILEGLTITNAPTLTLVQLVELSIPKRDLLLASCINMHYSIKDPLFTLHVSLSGTRMMSMSSQSTSQEVYNAYRPWMDTSVH
jgi:hypothetical protein